MPWHDIVAILLTIWDQVLAFSRDLGGFLSTTFIINEQSYSYLTVFFGAGFIAYFTYVFVKWIIPV